MDMIFAILGIVFVIWSIRSIFIKQQGIGKKLVNLFFLHGVSLLLLVWQYPYLIQLRSLSL